MIRRRSPWDPPAREPRLVLRFAVCTALGLALAAGVILVLVRQAYTAHAQREAIERAQFAADTVLGGQLRASDLRGPVTTTRRRQLDQLVGARLLRREATVVRLYDRRGRVVYATDAVAPGARSADAVAALRGEVASSVQSTSAGEVLKTFLPISLGSSGRSAGVVELDQDYGPVAAEARKSSLLIAGVLELLLLLLFVLLLPVLVRTARRIREHIAELDAVATHDELTGLPNRRGFRRDIDAALAGGAPYRALLLADVDSFHEINDTLGTDSADRLLEQIAARLESDLTDGDLIARLGEDEFGILTRADGDAEIERAAARVRETLSRPFVVDGARVGVEVKIGAAPLEPGGTDAETLLRRAGVALSSAKELQTPVEMYEPGQEAADIERLEFTAELREALAERQLTVYYQPQADLSTRAVRGVEALVRWQHPRRGLLTAAEFIPAAERTGLITEIGRYVLAHAAGQWHELDSRGIRFDVAVNLAAVDLLDARLPDEIAALLERHRLPPEYLVLEITERTLLRDERRTAQVLARLHGLGVRLAIDDFGTGYSSLAYLRRLPIQQVKLDRSFVSELPDDAGSEAIVRSTVELAHAFDATVIAEGVETREQWDCLVALGCDIAQGYFVGVPRPAAELTALVSARPGFPVVVAA